MFFNPRASTLILGDTLSMSPVHSYCIPPQSCYWESELWLVRHGKILTLPQLDSYRNTFSQVELELGLVFAAFGVWWLQLWDRLLFRRTVSEAIIAVRIIIVSF